MEYCNLETAKEIVISQFEKASNDLNLFERGFTMPKIIWRDMGVRRAGYCDYTHNQIHLNINYLKSKSWNEFLNTTPLHELAHAISWQLYDATGHKEVWKSVCYSLGLRGNRCHNFEKPEGVNVTKRKRKRYSAHCPCREHIITSVKYNRMLKGIRYICVKCHGDLKIGE